MGEGSLEMGPAAARWLVLCGVLGMAAVSMASEMAVLEDISIFDRNDRKMTKSCIPVQKATFAAGYQAGFTDAKAASVKDGGAGADKSLSSKDSGKKSSSAKSAKKSSSRRRRKYKDRIDIDGMVEEQRSILKTKIQQLKDKINKLRPRIKLERAKFIAKRKQIRNDFKACRKKACGGKVICKEGKKGWEKSSACSAFKASLLRKSLMESEDVGVQRKRRRKTKKSILKSVGKSISKSGKAIGKTAAKAGKAIGKTAAKAGKAIGKTAAKAVKDVKDKVKTALQAMCSKRAKCRLRQARREAKHIAKRDYEKIRKVFREWKTERRKASFQLAILPKVVKMLKPKLLAALGGADMANGEGGMLDGFPLEEMKSEDVLKIVMTYKLNAELYPVLTDKFYKIKKKIFGEKSPLKKAKDAIQKSLVASAGSVPFVGGALAVGAGLLVDLLWAAIQFFVKDELDMLKGKLQKFIVKSIIAAVFGTGLFTTEALQDPAKKKSLASAFNTAGTQGATKKCGEIEEFASSAKSAAVRAKQEAQNAEVEIASAAKKAGEEAAADEDEKEDHEMEEEADKADIDDDDE